ncbi:CsbD family protein [Martelella alba]|uniref:CsbD family protein n=1 Tax=Martelella alba TaxID=2590451 RepID=A0A506U9B1_9HYPH|nr:CsbD family protein [Martelella alba]TPW31032.1 CsbD family protein [Martelella alba]
MNRNRLEGNWKQFKGEIRAQWGKLSSDDIDIVAGEREKLIGKIQERYGKAEEDATREVDEWMSRH